MAPALEPQMVVTMKTKLFAISLLTMVGWTMNEPNAEAFHVLNLCCSHHCQPQCRPYNAFSPPCCPVACPGYCPLPYCNGWTPPVPQSYPSACDNGCCGDASMVSDPAYATSGPAMVIPSPSQVPTTAAPSSNFTPPPPTASPILNQTSMQWNPQAVYAQPTGFSSYPTNANFGNYSPAANYPAPPQMQVPSYWYNGR